MQIYFGPENWRRLCNSYLHKALCRFDSISVVTQIITGNIQYASLLAYLKNLEDSWVPSWIFWHWHELLTNKFHPSHLRVISLIQYCIGLHLFSQLFFNMVNYKSYLCSFLNGKIHFCTEPANTTASQLSYSEYRLKAEHSYFHAFQFNTNEAYLSL